MIPVVRNRLPARSQPGVRPGRAAPDSQVAEPDDRGSAVAEFVMVSVLLLMLLLGLLSVGLWAYTRQLMISAVSDAARYAANYGVSDEQAAVRAGGELTGLAGSTAASMTCQSSLTATAVGVDMVLLTCTMHTPGVFPLFDGWAPDITVDGHALKEELHP